MARKAFHIRLDEADIAAIEVLAKRLGVCKTQIVEDGLRMNLAKLKAYDEMDKGPPKAAKAKRAEAQRLTQLDPIMADVKWKPGRLPPNRIVRHPAPKAKPAESTRSVRGYAIDGSPIYR